MAPRDVELERKISLTTYWPGKMIGGMIKITERAKISTIRRASNTSSLGNMEVLPLELLHAIFAMLDFKTLSDMTRTCSRGLEVVRSLQEYSDLMRHAPLALVALGQTRLIRYHSSATVHAALLSPECASCQRYGPFLFLPTCQRCCYICLWRNRSLWVIPLSVAKKCFGLSTARVKKLPIMRSLPGKYRVQYDTFSRKRPMDLVCVGSAKRLALEVEGAEERMQQNVDARYSEGRLSWAQYRRLGDLQRAPLSPLGPSSVFEAKGRLFTADTYPGMASVSFPYLAPDKQAEHGSWCLGCKRTSRQWDESDMQSAIPKHLSHLLVAGRWGDEIMHATEDIAWAEKEFISHMDECPGAKELIACGTPENFDYQDWSWHTFSIGALADSDPE